MNIKLSCPFDVQYFVHDLIFIQVFLEIMQHCTICCVIMTRLYSRVVCHSVVLLAVVTTCLYTDLLCQVARIPGSRYTVVFVFRLFMTNDTHPESEAVYAHSSIAELNTYYS